MRRFLWSYRLVLPAMSGALITFAVTDTAASATPTTTTTTAPSYTAPPPCSSTTTPCVTLYAAPNAIGENTCADTADACALPTALSDVISGDTVDLAAGTYQPPSDTSFVITTSITLQPTTPGSTVVLDGNGDSVLVVGATATVSGVTIEGGTGAGIVNETTLTLLGSTVSDNTNPEGAGGISNVGILTVQDSTISDNQGSGIANNGTVTVEDSTISGNGGGGLGGGISSSGTVTVEDSTISANSTNEFGGGIFSDGSYGSLTVEDSTISGNSANIDGGGIQANSAMTVEDSTISGNSAEQGGGIFDLGMTLEDSTITGNTAGDGGGILNDGISTTVILAADIIADQGGGGDCFSPDTSATDAGYNIDDDGSCGLSASNDSVSDSSVIDDYLGTLSSNGGPTETIPLLSTSSPFTSSPDPAAAVIPSTFYLPVGLTLACAVPDQRGMNRGYPCDMGAFELSTGTPEAPPTGPTSGTSVPNSALPVGTYTAGTPFASGQLINIVIPANNVFSPSTYLNVVECAAPNGVIPLSPTACDGHTASGPVIVPSEDGSVNLHNPPGLLYPVYALPDADLSESVANPIDCGDTPATECILYIGDNFNDFAQPHVWSQPFFVTANTTGGTNSGLPAGDGSLGTPPASAPEAASVVALPVVALGLVGFAVWLQVQRRRRRAAA